MVVDKEKKEVKIIAQRTVAKYILSLREDGIFHCHVYLAREWIPEDFRQLYKAAGEMLNYKPAPIIVTHAKFAFPSAEATAYWGSPETACPYFSVEAQILDSLPLKVLGNFYLKFRRPKRPTKMFDNAEDGIVWLKTFM